MSAQEIHAMLDQWRAVHPAIVRVWGVQDVPSACAEARRRVHTSHAGAVQALLAARVPFRMACRYVMAVARANRALHASQARPVPFMKDYK